MGPSGATPARRAAASPLEAGTEEKIRALEAYEVVAATGDLCGHGSAPGNVELLEVDSHEELFVASRAQEDPLIRRLDQEHAGWFARQIETFSHDTLDAARSGAIRLASVFHVGSPRRELSPRGV